MDHDSKKKPRSFSLTDNELEMILGRAKAHQLDDRTDYIMKLVALDRQFDLDMFLHLKDKKFHFFPEGEFTIEWRWTGEGQGPKPYSMRAMDADFEAASNGKTAGGAATHATAMDTLARQHLEAKKAPKTQTTKGARIAKNPTGRGRRS